MHGSAGVFLLMLLTTLMSNAGQTSVRYTLGMPKPSNHLFEVSVEFENLSSQEDSIDLVLPVWRPGRYLILDFAGGVERFSASDGNEHRLRWEKVEKSRWRIYTAGSRTLVARYTVYANEFGQRTRGLNDEHAFVDGSAVFMYCERYRRLPVILTVIPFRGWHVTTGLEGRGTEFSAPNYDYFIDCPMEIGTQKDFTFDVDGTPHVLSIFGEGDWNADTLIRDIRTIVHTEKEFWGEFPYHRYVFLLHCTPAEGGGTEHLNSTIMGTGPYVFRNPESYRGFLGLVAHEFFHTWNVKQLRPRGLLPYDYTKENYSRELWVAEGTTSYYGELLLVRAGLIPSASYLDGIAGGIREDRLRPGNSIQPVSESSFDAWIKYWRGTEESYNAESDYYGKGAAVSGVLDLEIRRRSNNARSLDDVMRTMYRKFPLSGTGYTLDDYQRIAEEAAGERLGDVFRMYVYGTAPIPWEQVLSWTGLALVKADSVHKPWLGIGTSDAGDRMRVTRVIAGSPADDAGLDVGDEILALDGNRIRSSTLSDRIGEHKEGDRVKLTLFRDDHLREITVTLHLSPVQNYKVTKKPDAGDLEKRIFSSWTGTSWEAQPSAHAAGSGGR